MIDALLKSQWFWATSATGSAALSTIAYLFTIHGTAESTNFIHLYSTAGMLSAWLNTILFFLPEHYPVLHRRSSVLAVYAGASSLVFVIVYLLFSAIPTLPQFGFVLVVLLPILYANAYGHHLRAQNYVGVFSRTILLNLLLLLAALPAWWKREPAFLYTATAVLLPLGLIHWATSVFFRIDTETKCAPKIPLFRALLNPSVPVLERTLWDQFILLNFGRAELTFWFYAFSRMISFLGNISYSFSTQSALGDREKDLKLEVAWAFLFSIGLLIAVGSNSSLANNLPLLLGQAFSWLLAASLLASFEKARSTYGFLLITALLDFTARVCLFFASDSLASYNLGALILVCFCASILGLRTYLQSERHEFPSTN